jgi:hypothetical protein
LARLPSDVAFTASVKALQARRGSRRAYGRMEEKGSWPTRITPELATFIAERSSVFLATANRLGQPYIQHRGGPPGFIRVLDERTLAFADFDGNRQYITEGNLADNPKAHLFLIDYARRRRVKIWGEARVIEGDAELVARLMPKGYRARAERAIVLGISAWDENCPQHIPRLLDPADGASAIAERDRRIAELEEELRALRDSMAHLPGGTRPSM